MSDNHPTIVQLEMPRRWDPMRFQPCVPPEYLSMGELTHGGVKWIERLYAMQPAPERTRLRLLPKPLAKPEPHPGRGDPYLG